MKQDLFQFPNYYIIERTVYSRKTNKVVNLDKNGKTIRLINTDKERKTIKIDDLQKLIIPYKVGEYTAKALKSAKKLENTLTEVKTEFKEVIESSKIELSKEKIKKVVENTFMLGDVVVFNLYRSEITDEGIVTKITQFADTKQPSIVVKTSTKTLIKSPTSLTLKK